MRISEATFQLSNKKSKLDSLYLEIMNFARYPTELNGMEQKNTKEEETVKTILSEVVSLEGEILDLQKRINKANLEHGILDMLSEVKQKRQRLTSLSRYTSNSLRYENKTVSVENGNIVKYSPILKEEVDAMIESLEKEVEELSLSIDNLNSTIEI